MSLFVKKIYYNVELDVIIASNCISSRIKNKTNSPEILENEDDLEKDVDLFDKLKDVIRFL